MRVLHIMRSEGKFYGAERVLLTELVTLRARGVDARYLVLEETRESDAGDEVYQAAAAHGIPVIKVRIAHRFSLREVLAVRRAVMDQNPDLIHAHGYKGDFFGLLAGRLARVPLVGEVHGWLFPEGQPLIRFYEWLDAHALRRMDAAIVLSAYYRELLLKLGFAERSLRLIPSGIDVAAVRARGKGVDLRASFGLPAGCPTVGMLSRLSHEKGVDIFLEALALLVRAHPEARGIVFGTGPLEGELRAHAERLGLGAHLTWAGYVADSADALRSLDVLAMTSRIEALPQVLMEAMVLERPTVVTPVGGCPELCRDGETGIVVPDHSPEKIAAAIGRLLVDPAAARRMGEAGARRIDAEYSLEVWFERTLALYEELARR